MSSGRLQEIADEQQLSSLLSADGLVVVHFYADWASECQPMNDVLQILADDNELKNVAFAKIQAENLPKLSVQYKISAVPTFLFFVSGKQADRLDGANAAKLTQMVKSHGTKAQFLAAAATPIIDTKGVQPVKNVAPSADDLNSKLKALINQSRIMLFMKGNAENPQCGFSRQAVALLKQHNATFGTFDILKSEQVRQGLKTYSNWPTYPQLYVEGELIGGLDIMKEMDQSGELKEALADKGLDARLRVLINQARLMVFMKGSAQVPRCGFSRQLIEILNSTGLAYETFDILSDEDVRQGLKTFSNWPTYPQVYVQGDLVGGLDIIKELRESGELMSTLKGTD